MRKIIISLMAIVIIISGCTTRDNNIEKGDEEDNIIKGSEITGTIIPPDEASDWDIEELDDSDFVVEGTLGDVEGDGDDTDNTTPVYGEEEDVVYGSLTEPKYRVQVLAVTTKSSADEFADEVRNLVPGEEVLVQKIGEWWKVRVGNCSTRTEAEALKDELHGLGYSDAWIVSP